MKWTCALLACLALLPAAAATGRDAAPPSCPLHQDVTHRPRRRGKEVAATVPLQFRPRPVPHQPQICLVHQGRRLQGVCRGLLVHLRLGQLAQFAIHQREQLLRRMPITPGDRIQYLGYLLRRCCHEPSQP